MQNRTEPSLGELFADLTREMSTLVRQEVALASTEMSEKATLVGRNVGYLAVGGAIAHAGLLAIVAAAIIMLAGIVPWWAAALIVGVLVAIAGYLLVQQGLTALKQVNLAPRRTLDTLSDDVRWAKKQI